MSNTLIRQRGYVNTLFRLKCDFFYATVRNMEIAIVLRQARIAAGLEQRQLAQMMNVSASFVSDLEKGRRPFHDRYLDKLPDAVKPAVRAALVAEHEAQIRHLMKE